MAKFSFSEKLRTYEITVEVLEAIENYFLNEIPKLLNITSDDIKKHFTIRITDDLGDEEIKSSNDLPLSLFSDSIEHMDISVNFSRPKRFKFSIILDEKQPSTLLRISYEGDNARETAISITEGIKRILDHSKTNNYLFYPPDIVTGIILVFSLGLLAGISSTYERKLYAEMITAAIPIVVFILYYTLGKGFHPYTMFDSRRIRDYKRFNTWIFYSVLGFIIFDVVIVLLLKFWISI